MDSHPGPAPVVDPGAGEVGEDVLQHPHPIEQLNANGAG
jgi:hypothetical protein